MKKVCVIIMAVIMAMGLTQCKKKKSSTSTPSSSNVTITVEVVMYSFAKFNLDPTGGAGNVTMEFEDGDILYVGNDGKYVGKLKYSKDRFKGSVDKKKLSQEDYLHFYYLGNKKPEESLSAYSSTECMVNIGYQFEKYAVVAYGRSTELYSKSNKAYEAMLYNKCALVKFTTQSIKPTNPVQITGMNNMVTVDFAANIGDETVGEPFSYSVDAETNGAIVLNPVSDVERWAILLPQPEVTNAMASANGYVTETPFTVPEIDANGYYGVGVEINLVSGGAVEGEFSVSKTKKVYFSRANLKANTADNWNTWTWSFMHNQYDRVEMGDVTTNYNGEESVSLFGWATSGKNLRGTETDYYYKPFNTNNNGNNYGPNGLYSLIAGNRNGDWGVYNSTDITNGGGYATWRTLMKEEWQYLINFENQDNYRKVKVNGSKKVPYGKAVVMGVKGIIVLPDKWNGSADTEFVYGESAWANEYNTLSTPTWPELEASGVVFLPAAGMRDGSDVNDVNTAGNYWTVISGSEQDKAYVFSFTDGTTIENTSRSHGMSVRLVRNVE